MRRTVLLRSRVLCEAFWSPFNQRIVGHDLAKYAVAAAWDTALVPDNGFSCLWNGRQGGRAVAEDFFHVLLAGFDVAAVTLEKENNADDARFVGALKIRHARTFLGWRPSSDCVLAVPFTTSLTAVTGAGGARLARVEFSCVPALPSALLRAGCPPSVAALVTDDAALAMFGALRRARVKPEIITANALMSASRKQPAWSSALGIM